MGFEVEQGLEMYQDILVLGTHLLPSTISPAAKNPLMKVLDSTTQVKEILDLADLQKRWNANAQKVELVLGDPPKGKVVISKLGVVIDSCLLPITLFHKLEQSLLALKHPFIVSHDPIINRSRPFMTVGCADYSLDDLSKILTTYYSLS